MRNQRSTPSRSMPSVSTKTGWLRKRSTSKRKKTMETIAKRGIKGRIKNRTQNKLIKRRRPHATRLQRPALRIDWTKPAYESGLQLGHLHRMSEEASRHQFVNQLWHEWCQANGVDVQTQNGQPYFEAVRAFLSGYGQATGTSLDHWLLVPTTQTVGVIVTVMNEEKTIPSIIEQLQRLPLHEMIFIVNGTRDQSFSLIRQFSNATIIHYTHPLGHDVGRSIGAKTSTSDIVLFLDGDFPVFAEHLVPFVDAIERGVDVALNDISPYLGLFSERDEVTIMKQFLNYSLGRPDLGANSLTAVPHALSRKAIETIHYSNLMVPPKAQTAAILNGLKISSPMSVDVISKNRIRRNNVGPANLVSEMIIGDHIEALKLMMQRKGARLQFEDTIRKREGSS